MGFYDPSDGLKVNQINTSRRVSKRYLSFNIYEEDGVFSDLLFGSLKEISIMRRVRKANRYKSRVVNPDSGRLNGST